jgi:pseudouridine synthase
LNDFRYLVLNKPLGVTTTAVREKIKDPPQTVYDVLEAFSIDTHNLGCVCRLDQDTAGVLIFTDDGKLNSKIRGIRSTIRKLYNLIVFTGSKLSREQLDSLAIPLDGETLPACVEVVRTWSETVQGSHSEYLGNFAELFVTLVEGKHRQIRRLCTRAKLRVHALTRTGFGPVTISDLPTGAVRSLTQAEIEVLRDSCR